MGGQIISINKNKVYIFKKVQVSYFYLLPRWTKGEEFVQAGWKINGFRNEIRKQNNMLAQNYRFFTIKLRNSKDLFGISVTCYAAKPTTLPLPRQDDPISLQL